MGKKRRFAASVVVTIAALPACAGQSASGGGGARRAGSGSHIRHDPDGTCWQEFEADCSPGVLCNPPGPSQVDCATGQALPQTPPPGSGGSSATDSDGGVGGAVIATDQTPTLPPNVQRRPDGSCWLEEPMDCPPNVACNPPPPREVDCATGKDVPPDAPGVTRQPNGSCYRISRMHCPPHAMCNPPPPRPVDCKTGAPRSP
jgi:hypothetical protein